jgi:hypothetical protein
MKAFISYSINDKDQVILTLLSLELRRQHFVITTSQNFYTEELDYTTTNQIEECHLFIGIITRKSLEQKRVLKEWEYSKKRNIPNILLIEDSIIIKDDFKGNIVRFNRSNNQEAIDFVKQKMTPKNRLNQTTVKAKQENDILPWLLGGTALLAILLLLYSTSNKKSSR